MALRQVLNSVSKIKVDGKLPNLNKILSSNLSTATSKRKLIVTSHINSSLKIR